MINNNSMQPQSKLIKNIPYIASLLTLILHLLGNPHYGFFRDELYFIMCGFHPDWGYADQPPLVPFLAAGSQLFGHSLFLLRAIPALFASASVYVTCLLVIELGGNTFALILASIVVSLCPTLVNFGSKLSTDTVGLVFWPLITLLILKIIHGANPRIWIIIGILFGLTFLAKYSIVFFSLALFIGMLTTSKRKLFYSKWVIVGAIIGAFIILPNIIWQAHFNFPMLAILNSAQHGENIILSPTQYITSQLIMTGECLSFIWIVGLVFLFWRPDTRFLAIMYIALIGLMILFHGKHYYPANVYPILISAGAVAIELLTNTKIWLRYITIFIIMVNGVYLLPHNIQILPISSFIKYDQFREQMRIYIFHKDLGKLTKGRNDDVGLVNNQDWADMHGWTELTNKVYEIVKTLPSNERAHAIILTNNYGEAAALQFFGAQYDLPPILSGNNQYYFWGKKNTNDGDILIAVNYDCSPYYRSSNVVAKFQNSIYGAPYENNISIMICRGIKEPLPQIWYKFKRLGN